MKFYRYRMFLHISAAAEFSIHLVNLVNLILLEVEGNGRKNAEDVDYWMFWNKYGLVLIIPELTVRPPVIQNKLNMNFLMKKTIKLWRLRQRWQLLHLQTGIWIHVWKQPRVHNQCSFCLFNLKNEGFCIMEVWIPHVFSDKL